MSIKFYLLDNKLTPDPRDRRAVVLSSGTKTMEDVIEEAVDMGTLVTKTDMRAVTEIMFKVMAKFVAEGFTLNTPIFNIRPSIKGVFATELSTFNPDEHEIKPKLLAGILLKEYMAKATAEKVEASNTVPLIKEFLDETSGSPDSEITPGGMGIVAGSRLAFDSAAADEGLFFIDSSGTETKVSRIAKALPGELIFQIPDTLSTGDYQFVIRTRGQSKDLRVSLPRELEVK